MRMKFWVDVFTYSTEANLFPSTYPIIPKPTDCVRYMITCELPEFTADADQLIIPQVEKVEGKNE